MKNEKKIIHKVILLFVVLPYILSGCSTTLKIPKSPESSMLIGYIEFNNSGGNGINVNYKDQFGIRMMRNIPIKEGVNKNCKLIIKKCENQVLLKLTYKDGYYYSENIDDGCYIFESIKINLGNSITFTKPVGIKIYLEKGKISYLGHVTIQKELRLYGAHELEFKLNNDMMDIKQFISEKNKNKEWLSHEIEAILKE